ncbi:MAG TPA: hypothetical protein VFV97_13660, partial [Rhodanobacteraceae bacterium]|nr:hypothetical protein [Rhodanobacteraceae bacterium]
MSDSKTPRLAQSALALLLAVTGDAGALTLIDVAGGRLSPPEALDHYLYIGSGTSLDVWDIADYSAPVRVDRISLAPVCGVTLAGGYLYACAGTSQLGGIAGATLTDPAHPQFVNGRQGAPPTLHIVGVDNDLYTLDGANGLQVFDTPDLFWLASSNTLLGDVREVSLQGDTLLAMGWNPNGDELLTAFDIANPLHPEPTLVEFVTLGSSSIRDHALTRNYMIELLSSGLAVYDAHDLGNITLLSSRTTGPATRELVDGNVLYVFGDTTLQLYDLTALPNLVPLTPAPIDTSGTQEVLATGHGVLMLTNAGVATLIDDTRVATPT